MIDANQRFDSSRFEEGKKRIFQQNLMIDETFEATTVNKTNPGTIHLRLCVWLRSGHHEDGRVADVHLRHILHPQTLPREGGRLQTRKGINEPVSVAGRLLLPVFLLLHTLVRCQPRHHHPRQQPYCQVGQREGEESNHDMFKMKLFAGRTESYHDKEIEHEKWRS